MTQTYQWLTPKDIVPGRLLLYTFWSWDMGLRRDIRRQELFVILSCHPYITPKRGKGRFSPKTFSVKRIWYGTGRMDEVLVQTGPGSPNSYKRIG